MANYYIFRINYDEYYDYIVSEIKEGKLRQGWSSGVNLDLRKHNKLSYRGEYEKIWGEVKESKLTSFFSMLNFKPGDIVIIPKAPIFYHFYILEVTGKYIYDYSARKIDDFRHIIPVKILKKVAYDSVHESKLISARFGSYRYPVNRINKENSNNKELIEAINEIIETDIDLEKNIDHFKALDMWNNPKFTELAKSLLSKITSWKPNDLEAVVNDIFEHNGFTLLEKNKYDGEGGDIDLLFQLPISSLWDEIYYLDITHSENEYPTLAVQVKNKKEVDYNARAGVEQLVKMKNGGYASFYMLLTTSEKIDEDTIKYAKKNNIVIIHGIDFAKLLVKYGLGLTKLVI